MKLKGRKDITLVKSGRYPKKKGIVRVFKEGFIYYMFVEDFEIGGNTNINKFENYPQTFRLQRHQNCPRF